MATEPPYHELFLSAMQPHLLKKNFTPSQDQLDRAKQSLIEKHKLQSGVQQLLFCKNSNSQQDLVSSNQKKAIETSKKNYLDFVRKNYNQKISDELTSVGKLREKINEFQERETKQKQRKWNQESGKNLMEQDLRAKRGKKDQAKAGRKKVKTDEKKEPSKAAKGRKGNESKREIKEEVIRPPSPVEDNPESIEQSSEHISDLINSLSQDDLENFQEDED